jgi:hypothetical protein
MKLFGFDVDESVNQIFQNAKQLKKDLTPTPFPSGPDVWEQGKQNGDKVKEDLKKAPVDKWEKMSWSELIQLRNSTTDPELQKQIAPYEHRAYAREDVEANPEKALLYPLLIPGYQAAKEVGIVGARTEPSVEQMQQGFIGVYEGLRNKLLSTKE